MSVRELAAAPLVVREQGSNASRWIWRCRSTSEPRRSWNPGVPPPSGQASSRRGAGRPQFAGRVRPGALGRAPGDRGGRPGPGPPPAGGVAATAPALGPAADLVTIARRNACAVQAGRSPGPIPNSRAASEIAVIGGEVSCSPRASGRRRRRQRLLRERTRAGPAGQRRAKGLTALRGTRRRPRRTPGGGARRSAPRRTGQTAPARTRRWVRARRRCAHHAGAADGAVEARLDAGRTVPRASEAARRSGHLELHHHQRGCAGWALGEQVQQHGHGHVVGQVRHERGGRGLTARRRSPRARRRPRR